MSRATSEWVAWTNGRRFAYHWIFFVLSQAVTSANETLRRRVESVVDMALTTVSSLSEMYSGNASSAVNDVVIKPVERTPDADIPEVNPTTTEGEDDAKSKEVEA